MRRRAIPVAALALVLAALASPLASAPDDSTRLGRDVLPAFESVRLSVDPARPESFGGEFTRIMLLISASVR